MPLRTPALIPAAAAAVVLALVLTGCVPEPEPGPTPGGNSTVAPTTPASPTNDARVLTIPSCDQIFTAADVPLHFGDTTRSIAVGSDFDETAVVPEDHVAVAVGNALATQSCIWGIPQTDAAAVLVVAELGPAAAAALRPQLEADTAATATELDGALLVTKEETEGFGHVHAVVLLDSLLLATQDMHTDALRHVLAAMRSANPDLPAAPAESTPPPSATPTPTASPSPTPDAGGPGAVLPACANLLPLSTVHALFGDAAEPIETGGSAADHMPGPLAADTVRSARQTEMCTWGIPFSDGGFSVITAELTRSARDRLIASLRAASSYAERTLDGEVSFTHEEESELGTTAVVYVFVDDVWITVDGTLSIGTAREFAGSAVDAVRAANA